VGSAKALAILPQLWGGFKRESDAASTYDYRFQVKASQFMDQRSLRCVCFSSWLAVFIGL
jgi:hypothetical protein